MKMYMIIELKSKGHKTRKKIIFQSEHYYDKGDQVEIAIPKGDIAEIIRVDKANIREIERYSEKIKEKKVVNKLTQF